MTQNISNTQIKHIAGLANIPVTDEEAANLAHAFDDTLKVIENLKSCDVSQVQPTHQVTGLENVMREDVVDEQRMFSQADALKNAQKVHEGYFVVPQVIKQD